MKNLRTRLLPPIAPLVKLLPQTNDTEFHELKNGRTDTARQVDTTSKVETESFPDVRSCTEIASTATTRRSNVNMTSDERMLQRENRRSRKKSVRSYTILDMEAEDQEIESNEDNEGSTLRVVEEDTLVAQSSTSVHSRCSSTQDPNQALLKYFAKLSNSLDLEDSLDLEHIKSLKEHP